MNFIPSVVQHDFPNGDSFIIPFFKNYIYLVREASHYRFPKHTEINCALKNRYSLGKIDARQLWVANIVELSLESNSGLVKLTTREAFNILPENLVKIIGLAFQLLNWNQSTRFCSHCSAELTLSNIERAKICPTCDSVYYPRINPSIIVSIIKGNQILLARSPRFPETMYSVIAGFVEVGETLEECVEREIKEEVGVEVCNIRYFKSQNWPFPNSLMIAYTSEYSSGEITIDNNEIVDAKWFTKEDFPTIPSNFSVAGQLINDFLEKTKNL